MWEERLQRLVAEKEQEMQEKEQLQQANGRLLAENERLVAEKEGLLELIRAHGLAGRRD